MGGLIYARRRHSATVSAVTTTALLTDGLVRHRTGVSGRRQGLRRVIPMGRAARRESPMIRRDLIEIAPLTQPLSRRTRHRVVDHPALARRSAGNLGSCNAHRLDEADVATYLMVSAAEFLVDHGDMAGVDREHALVAEVTETLGTKTPARAGQVIAAMHAGHRHCRDR